MNRAVALLVLSAVPLVAGILRIVQLAGGPAVMPADDRFDAFPVALLAHILGAAVYAVGGAFQFVPGLRRRHLTWHRRAGRVLAAAGLVVAGSALWLTLFYSPQPGTGDLLFALRLVFAPLLVVALVLGVRAARAGDLDAHRAWMIRAYAVALAAGTQVVLGGFGDLGKGAAWVVNLAVAEWVIRRRPSPVETPETAPARPVCGQFLVSRPACALVSRARPDGSARASCGRPSRRR